MPVRISFKKKKKVFLGTSLIVQWLKTRLPMQGTPRTYSIAQRTPLSVMWMPGWERVWKKMDMCICMTEFLCCLPETITTLSISYTPVQNKKCNIKKGALKNKVS